MNGVVNGHLPIREVDAVGLIRQMLDIPSPSYEEAAIARYLVDTMTGLGFTASIDEAGNATGVIRRGDGPTVMLLGHMDTAPGTVRVRSADGRLYGRGAVDAKGPLATMICAAASAVDYAGTIVVIGAVEEETPGSRGAVSVRDNHRLPDAAIIGEPSGWASIVVGYKGKLDLRYRVERPATHPTNPAPKADELAVECWNVIGELVGPTATHASFDLPGLTLVSMSGDIAEAEVDITVRTPLGFDAASLLEQLRSRCPDGELTVLNNVAACQVDRRSPVVLSLCNGIRAQRAQPVLKVRTGTSDMNTLAESWDVPMATYGPGDNALDHSDDEHLILSDYLRGISVLRAGITELSRTLQPHR
ncbi:MAG: M20/M25/M40 family metallo-hydrolase [Jatrophihabitantaceae bacterium]